MLGSTSHQLGRWTFVPAAHELRSGDDRVRLEQRASATLALLAERRGQVVSQAEIIDRAWGRRHLSSNSVAVVIGDLRRALDLPTGSAGSIETVPKAGYRMLAAEPDLPRGRKVGWLVGGLAAALTGIGLISTLVPPSDAATIGIGSIETEAGTLPYRPLIEACNAHLLVELGKRSADWRVDDQAPLSGPRQDYILVQRWVLWSGRPELILIARDDNGAPVWTTAIYGDENAFPGKIAKAVDEFARVVGRRVV